MLMRLYLCLARHRASHEKPPRALFRAFKVNDKLLPGAAPPFALNPGPEQLERMKKYLESGEPVRQPIGGEPVPGGQMTSAQVAPGS
jgi:hypothetical protein